MRTLTVCACALALAAWGCSNGDGNGNGTPPVCGNNQCEAGETCTNCAQDCGCPAWRETCFNGECIACGDRVCNGGENCSSCVQDCGCGGDQMCREGVCVVRNPLIDAIPGTWDLLEVNGGSPSEPVSVMLRTDTAQPLCGYDPPPAGDACVRGFSGPSLFLDGTRLYIPDDGGGVFLDGQVLNDGTRIEYDYSAGPVVENDVVWVKRE